MTCDQAIERILQGKDASEHLKTCDSCRTLNELNATLFSPDYQATLPDISPERIAATRATAHQELNHARKLKRNLTLVALAACLILCTLPVVVLKLNTHNPAPVEPPIVAQHPTLPPLAESELDALANIDAYVHDLRHQIQTHRLSPSTRSLALHDALEHRPAGFKKLRKKIESQRNWLHHDLRMNNS